ncbi:MAG: PAS domain-containing protein [Planctomycetes bacterium]|nr:PAS domain-containing protein [Planctomycetota bacterium]
MAILACEPDGSVVAWNAATEKLFGCIGGLDARGAPVSSVFPERHRATVGQHLAACISSQEPVEFRVRLGGTEAEPIEYAVYITPVQESGGSLRGVAVWLRDITARVRLQRMVKKRERLTSLGALCGSLAHHYNNLLCSIATSVEYAMNMNTMTAMRRTLQRTTEAIARAADITHKLLIFAQADHRPADFSDLTEIVLYFCDQNELRAAQRHVKLVVDCQEIPPYPVPREQFLLVLNCLMDNALEVMQNGGMLVVTLERRDENNVCVSVTDTGGGLRPEAAEHLFEPFCTTKGELGAGPARNAGMGLAVAHGLISEMQGAITATDVPGRGARFEIVLPLNHNG